MAKTIKALVNTTNQETGQLLEVVQGSGDKGQPTRIKAIKGARYELQEHANQDVAVQKVRSKRVGKHLHVMLEGSAEADLIVEDYYEVNQGAQGVASLYGRGSDGVLYEYATESAGHAGMVINPWVMAGGALAATGGGGVTSGSAVAVAGAVPVSVTTSAPVSKVTAVAPNGGDAPVVMLLTDANDDGMVNAKELGARTTWVVNASFDSSKVTVGDRMLFSNGTVTKVITLTQDDLDNGFVRTTFAKPAEGGVLKVTAKLKDNLENLSAEGSDSAKLDTVLPNGGKAPTVSFVNDKDNDGSVSIDEYKGEETFVVKASFDKTKVVAGDKIIFTDVDNTSSMTTVTLTQADVDNGFATTSFFTPQEGVVLTVNALVRDVAGNSGAKGVSSVKIDTSAPTTKVDITAISQDTGVSSADFITSDKDGLTISAKLSATLASDEKLFYSNDNGATWTDITDSVSGTTVSHIDANLTSTTTIRMQVRDQTNNTGPTDSQLITIDVTGPTEETASLTIDSITSDNVLNAAEAAQEKVAIRGIARGEFTAGDAVTVTINGNNFSGTVGEDGKFSIDVTSSDLRDATPKTVSASLSATDVAGNTGKITDTQNYTVDITAPTTTVLITAITQDTGVSASDFITSDNNGLTVSATLSEALATGEALFYSKDNGTTWTDITASVNGKAVSHADASLTSTTTIRMQVRDAVQNIGETESQLVTIDTSGNTDGNGDADPNTSASVSITQVSKDTGVSTSDFITSDQELVYSGTVTKFTANGAAVSLVLTSADGVEVARTFVTPLANGSWSWDETGVSRDSGNYTLLATIVDAAGNAVTGAGSDSQIITVDADGGKNTDNGNGSNKPQTDENASSKTAVSIDGISADSGSNVGDFITNDPTLVYSGSISGFTANGDVVKLELKNSSNTVIATQFVTPASTGAWAWDDSMVARDNGSYTLVATLVDKAGNAISNAGKDSQAITINSELNEAPVNTVPDAQTVNEDTQLAISGISVADIDGNLATTQLSVGHGSISVDLAGGASISTGANGSAALTLSGTQAQINAALGTLKYMGAGNFNGTDKLTMLSTDSAGTPLSDSDELTINISAVNDAPVVANDTASATEAGGTSNGTAGTNPTGNVISNDSDVDNATSTLTVKDIKVGTASGAGTAVSASTTSADGTSIKGSFGTLKIGADGSYVYTVDNTNATVQALKANSTALSDVFSYTVRNADGLTSMATITVSVAGANDAPTVANVIADTKGTEDVALSYVIPVNSFSDVEGDSLTLTAVVVDSNGNALATQPTWFSFDASTRTVSGTPPAGAGTVHVKVTANDGSLSVSDTFDISVTPANNAPKSNASIVGFSTDISRPSVVITDNKPNVATVNEVVRFTLNFSEEINPQSLTESDLYLSAGALVAGSLKQVAGTNSWTVDVKMPSSGSGNLLLQLADGSYSNLLGQTGLGSHAVQTYGTSDVITQTAVSAQSYTSLPGSIGLDNGLVVVAETGATRTPYAKVYDQAGNLVRYVSFSMTYGSTTQQQNYRVGVVKLSDGNFLLAAEGYPNTGVQGQLQIQKFSQTGAAIGSTTVLSSDMSLDYYSQDLGVQFAALSNGGYAVAYSTWATYSDISSKGTVVVQVRDASNTLVKTTTLNDPALVGASDSFQAIKRVGNSDDFVVTWLSQDPAAKGGDKALWVQKFNASGQLKGSATKLDVLVGDAQSNKVTIEPADDGGYFVSWWETPQNSSVPNLYIQRFAEDSSPVGEIITVTDNVTSIAGTEAAHEPNVIFHKLGNGSYSYTWIEAGLFMKTVSIDAQGRSSTKTLDLKALGGSASVLYAAPLVYNDAGDIVFVINNAVKTQVYSPVPYVDVYGKCALDIVRVNANGDVLGINTFETAYESVIHGDPSWSARLGISEAIATPMANGSVHVAFTLYISDGYAYGGSGLDGHKVFSVVVDAKGVVTSTSSTLTGTTSADTLVGTSSTDTITGGGGADRINAGEGSDTVTLNASNISSFSGANTMSVDGGTGVNTLILADTGVLDLTNSSVLAKLKNFSTFDISGTGNNTLRLDWKAITQLSGALNSSTTPLDESRMLVVNGSTSGDKLELYGLSQWGKVTGVSGSALDGVYGAAWKFVSNATYTQYSLNGSTLYVRDTITVSNLSATSSTYALISKVQTVASMFGPGFSDADAGQTMKGVVVVNAGTTAEMSANGSYQYSLDNGLNWVSLPQGLSDAAGIYLPSTALIRYAGSSSASTLQPQDLQVRLVDSSNIGGTSAWEAGNTYDVSSNGGSTAISGATVTVRNAQQLTAPTILSLTDDIGTQTGVFGSGVVTDDAYPVIKGTAAPLSQVELYQNDTLLGTVVADGSGTWSFQYPIALANGTVVSLTAFVRNTVLNTLSSASNSFAFTVEGSALGVSAPVITSIVDDVGSAQGLVNNGTRTDDSLPLVKGIAQSNVTVELWQNDVLLATTKSNAQGQWSYQYTDALTNTTKYELVARSVDGKNVKSDFSNKYVFTLDGNEAPTLSANTLRGTFDFAAAPEVVITDNVLGDSGNGQVVRFTMNFSEPINPTTLTLGDITALNGTIISNTLTQVSDKSWTVDVQMPVTGNGSVGIALAQGAYAGLTGTLGLAGSATQGYNLETNSALVAKNVATTTETIVDSVTLDNGDVMVGYSLVTTGTSMTVRVFDGSTGTVKSTKTLAVDFVTGTTTEQNFRMLKLNNGNVLVTGKVGSGYQWYGQVIDATGAIVAPPVQYIDSTTTQTGTYTDSSNVTTTPAAQFDVTALGNGNYVVVYPRAIDNTSFTTATNSMQVDVKLYNSKNELLRISILDNADLIDMQPMITSIGSNGEFAVSWVSRTTVDKGNDLSIWVQKFSAKGLAVNSPAKLEVLAHSNEYLLDTAQVDSNGDFVTVFSSKAQAQSSYSTLANIFYQRFNTDGTLDGELIQVTDFQNVDYQVQMVQVHNAGLPSGSFALTWQESSSALGVGTRSVHTVVYDATGLKTSDTNVLLGNSLSLVDTPLVINAQGDMALVLSAGITSPYTVVMTNKFGQELYRTSITAPTNQTYLSSPTLSVLGDGNVALAFQSSGTSTQTHFVPVIAHSPAADTSTLSGTTGNDNLVGTDVADVIAARGGADRIFAGAGNDVITINAASVSSLIDTTATTVNMLIDGGSGVNALVLANGSLDLTNTTVRGKLHSINTIDITGTANNSLSLDWQAIATMSRTADVASTAADESRMLVVNGNIGDTVRLAGLSGGLWKATADMSGADLATTYGAAYSFDTAGTYTMYVLDGVTLFVNSDISMASLNVSTTQVLYSAVQKVGELFNTVFVDVNSTQDILGVAINSVAASTNGSYEYSVNSGTTWVAMSTSLSDASALYLSNSALIRYKTNAGQTSLSSPNLTARLIDDSGLSGTGTWTSGSLHDVQVNGGSTAISKTAVQLKASYVAPVVLDLNQDGILSYGQVTMDVNGDGVLDSTLWAGQQDGVLVWDKYHDGQVHNHTQYALTEYGGRTDLEGLAVGFDSNHDGVFNAADTNFGEFKVWQDVNQNGISDAGEVRSLVDLGLTAIDLTSDGITRTPIAGVIEAGQSAATLVDGSYMLVADAGFAYQAATAAEVAARTSTVQLTLADVLCISQSCVVETWAANQAVQTYDAGHTSAAQLLIDQHLLTNLNG